MTSNRPGDLEQRVGAALHAEVDGIAPDPDSLSTIRERSRTARRRRRSLATAGALAVVVAAVAIAVPALRDDTSNVTTDTDPAPPTTEAPVVSEFFHPIWPDPAGAEQFDDPEAAVTSFVETVVGVDDPPFGAVRQVGGTEAEVEVEVYDRSEGGAPLDTVATTLSLSREAGRWYVTGARSDDVSIASPPPGAVASFPLAVSGEGRGYEGTIAVEVRAMTVDAPALAGGSAIAGADGALAPYTVEVDLPADLPDNRAILVARTDPGTDLGVPHVAAQALALPSATSPSTSSPGSSIPASPADPGADFELAGEPLWPFRTYEEAEAWRAGADEGHQPWHAEADETARSFTVDFLGFTELGQVTSIDERPAEAWIGVGYTAEPGGAPSTAAVIHLVRFGPHPDSPWEVVGTRDTTLTLDTPRYGTAVTSPVAVGGQITGVDECIHVAVRQSSSAGPLGTAACVPAGGEATPWSSQVAWTGATDPALTIVAWTGGHVQDVELFAITGVPG